MLNLMSKYHMNIASSKRALFPLAEIEAHQMRCALSKVSVTTPDLHAHALNALNGLHSFTLHTDLDCKYQKGQKLWLHDSSDDLDVFKGLPVGIIFSIRPSSVDTYLDFIKFTGGERLLNAFQAMNGGHFFLIHSAGTACEYLKLGKTVTLLSPLLDIDFVNAVKV